MRREEKRQIERLLRQNRPPRADGEKAAALKRELRSRAEGMDFQVCAPGESYMARVLRQIPYITGWVWIVQAAVAAVLLAAAGESMTGFEAAMFLSFTAPVLALLPVVDVIRSYGHNMCEMEAACRYDLRQITAMRMCVIGSVDLVLLAAGGWLYQEKCGSIWEFGLFVLLPFLAGSSLYCWELHRFSAKCSVFVLLATGIVLDLLGYPMLRDIHLRMTLEHPEWIPALALSAVTLLSGGMICSAVRLCAGMGAGNPARAGRSHIAGA